MNYFKKGINVGLVLLAGSQFLAAAGNSTDKTKVSTTKIPATKVPVAVETPSNITMDDAVRIALKQNPQVLEAIQLIEETKGEIITVRAEALPNVQLTGAYDQSDPNLIKATGQGTTSGTNSSGFTSSQSQTGSGQDKTWNVTVQATQLLYSGGQVGAAIKIAKLTLDSNYFNLRDVVDQTISTVRQQFYSVLLDRELIKVQEQSVELLKSQLKDQQNRFDAGTVPRFNVLQAQVALANQLPPLIKAKETYVVAMLTLARTLGIPYNPLSAGQKPLNAIGDLTVHTRSVNVPEAISIAKEDRSFLKVQRQTILIQLQQIKVALAGYQPTLTASAGYQVRNSPFSVNDKLSEVVNGWFFGVNGSWAIFDGGSTYGKVKTARAQLESAKVNYDDAVLQVELQVQQAIASLKEADETIESQTKSVEEAVEALRLAQERLNAGAGVQLDVLNAQVALLTAQSNELQAKHDYNVALAQFEYAIGAATRYNDSFDDPLTHQKSYVERPLVPRARVRKDIAKGLIPMSAAPSETFAALDLPAIRHAFIGRVPGLDVSVDREEALRRLGEIHVETRQALGFGAMSLVTAEQVHGKTVAVIGADAVAQPAALADGMVTNQPDVALGIYVADCCAIYLVDPVKRAIGLVHSGRKGTELGIATAAIETMVQQFGSEPSDIIAQLSPCIRPPDYEVDFAASIVAQCRAAGLRNVFDCGKNTAADLKSYYSYRIEHGKTGRMLALLALN